jgi:hypothetical protein
MNSKNRDKMLIHLRRISDLFDSAIRNGPDGSLEGKFKTEHPQFTHYLLSFYLIGSLAYLTGADGEKSWNKNGQDFDKYAQECPKTQTESFYTKGVSKKNLDALAQLRNSLVHNDGDLSKNRETNSLAMVLSAKFPGVLLDGTKVKLEQPFLEYVRLSVLAVKGFLGEY